MQISGRDGAAVVEERRWEDWLTKSGVIMQLHDRSRRFI